MSSIDVFLHDFLMISSVKTIGFILLLIGFMAVIAVLTRKKVSFGKRVTVAMVLGLGLGVILQVTAGFPSDPTSVPFLVEATTWFGLVGNGYMAFIRMLVVPLVMVSIIHVFINMEEGAQVGKMVRNSIVVTMVMVAVAAVVGLALGLVFNLGVSGFASVATSEIKEVSSIVATLQGLIPSNPVKAMVDVNVIALVIFSIFIAFGAKRMYARQQKVIQPFYDLVNALHKIIISITMTIIKFMPYAVVPLLANTIAIRGLESIKEVGVFIGVLYIAVVVMFVIQMLLLMAFGLNPITFIKKAVHALVLAFTSRSSVGTLPVTIDTLTNSLGVNDGTASFVASFGTTAGMQGCAGIFPALLIVYVCNQTGTPLDITMLIMSVIVISLGSLGIAGIPGTATMAASVSLSGTGLEAFYPLISPILAVDPLVDMGRTFLNVSGSMVNAIVVDKTLKQLNEKDYNDMNLTRDSGEVE